MSAFCGQNVLDSDYVKARWAFADRELTCVTLPWPDTSRATDNYREIFGPTA